ncbi:transcription antitermination factor NusB [Candidatus Hydrogenosomobacter endosymbioticus]|uniref:N utilization substance protein B n=1 Tax=Candidatus Hydrogenosomobacter endosymbioticus TaxID=2558174 RepID=A0ABM7V8F1_9PROT|nr:transcription antitermination factor NusB [Candidatus Hydrogenosomobacter endosymbioticus]BDB96054.1 N utilization substance protein B [Candidatus Hydrogenosomobacter endosymbioticus]
MLPRRVARIAAVQVLFLHRFNDRCCDEDFREFVDWNLVDNNGYKFFNGYIAKIDFPHLRNLFNAVCDNMEKIDSAISGALPDKWDINKLELSTRCILENAVCELLFFGSVPAAVVIDEYIELSHMMLLSNSHSLVNAIIDKIAKAVGDERENIAVLEHEKQAVSDLLNSGQ